jgi:hypothetical protein
MDEQIVARFRALDAELAARHPDARRDAEALATQVVDPATADADAVWRRAWDKPLFANTQVAIGVAATAKLGRYMPGAWRSWGVPGSAFVIEKVGKGISVEAFRAVGPLAQQIRKETGIALHRLYAIQGAAAAMRLRAAASATPYLDLTTMDVATTVRAVQREMGPGWGHITVLHFLTELGLTCKPDLHLVRTVRHLGMSLDLRDMKVPRFADAVTINRRVQALAEAVYGSAEPARLRYLDKVLMELSLRRVIDAPLADWRSAPVRLEEPSDAIRILTAAWPAIVEECRAMLGGELHYQAVVYHCLRQAGVPRMQLGMNVKQWIANPVTPLFQANDLRKHLDYRGGFEPIPDVVLFGSGVVGDWRRRNADATLRHMLLAMEVKASERADGRLSAREVINDVRKLAAHRAEVAHRGGKMAAAMLVIDVAPDANERMREADMAACRTEAETVDVAWFYVSALDADSVPSGR